MCPMEYHGLCLKRQLILLLTIHAEYFLKYLRRHIFYEYNNPVAKKNFSYKDYLLHMLEDNSWGDHGLICSMSVLWELKISIVFPERLAVWNIKHNVQDLSYVDLVLLFAKGMHYSPIGKCGTGRRRS